MNTDDDPRRGPATTRGAEALVRHRTWLLLALGLLIWVPFLGMRDLWYPDEPDIAEVCKAMFDSGDWVSPRRNGEIWVDYPPMIYWAGTIASHALGGMSAFSLRLPNALAAVAIVLLTCAVGSRWFDRRTGLAAGFMILTFQQFAYQAVSYRPDVLFTLAVAAGLFVYAAGAGERPRWLLRVAGFALLGVAMLAKGPLGLLLPGLVLTLWHGTRREWRRLIELAPLSLVALAVYLPWFAACARAMGSDDILHELWAQNFQRFLSGSRGHEQPWHYYLTAIWADLFPWAPLLPFAVTWVFRSRLWRDRGVQLALWWFGTFFVFLSLAVTKRQLYLLPAYPAAALLLAPWVSGLCSADRSARARPSARPAQGYGIVAAVLLGVLGLLLTAAAVVFEPVVRGAGLTGLELSTASALRAPVAAAGLLLVATGAWVGLAWWRSDTRGVLVRLGVAQLPLYVLLLAWLLPTMDPVRTYRPQCAWVRARIGDATHIGLANPHMGKRKMGAFGYYTGALVDLVDRPEEIERFFDRHPGSLVLVLADAAPGIFAGDEEAWRARVVGELEITRDVYLAVRARPSRAAI